MSLQRKRSKKKPAAKEDRRPVMHVLCLDEVVPVYYTTFKGCDGGLGINYPGTEEETKTGGEIRICQWQTEADKEKTLLHELIHHIDDILSINLKETQVEKLEGALYHVLTQNGWLKPMLKQKEK